MTPPYSSPSSSPRHLLRTVQGAIARRAAYPGLRGHPTALPPPLALAHAHADATQAWVELLTLGMQAAAAQHEPGYYYPRLLHEFRAILPDAPSGPARGEEYDHGHGVSVL